MRLIVVDPYKILRPFTFIIEFHFNLVWNVYELLYFMSSRSTLIKKNDDKY